MLSEAAAHLTRTLTTDQLRQLANRILGTESMDRASHPSTGEVETEGAGLQGQSPLHNTASSKEAFAVKKKKKTTPPESQRAPEAAPPAAHLHSLRLVDALLVAADVESILHVEQLVYISGSARGRAGSRRCHVDTPRYSPLPGTRRPEARFRRRELWET